MALTDGQITPASGLDIKAELDETQRALREVTLMLEQSQGEVKKLSQRNTAITSHLQQVQKQLDQLPPEEIRMAYDSALDAQQRLLVMRGQLEKLQSDQTHLQQRKNLLETVKKLNSAPQSGSQTGKRTELSGMEMVVNAQESERQRLSRLMHDGPAQAMSNFILQAEIAMRLLDINPDQAREELSNLKTSAMSTFQKVRNFIFELRPMMLDDLGLIPTIRKYIETFKEQSGLEVGLNITGEERRLEAYIEVMFFRALQELLGNASRHSQCTLIKVHVDISKNAAKLSVDDNGKGFDPDGIVLNNSLGLKLIQDRVELLGGTFQVDSAIGKGTRVSFTLPAEASL